MRFLAVAYGGLLHRILHRPCTGFCTASNRRLKVAFEGVPVMGIGNSLRVAKPRRRDEAGILRGQFCGAAGPTVDKRFFPLHQPGAPDDRLELGP